MSWVPHGLRNGVLTTHWPRRPDRYFDEFPAAITVAPGATATEPARLAANACPTDAITVSDTAIRLDRGRCILCGRCAALAPETFRIASGSAVAATRRSELVVSVPAETDESISTTQRQIADAVRLLRRSVHIRHIDTGSDGSEEWEIQALTNPVYDVQRLGVFFTASPRHADILLVTGVGAEGMIAPLRRTRESMPDPVVVIACGTDAISGGLAGGAYGSQHPVEDLLPVDVRVPGAPPSPFSILQGILLAIGRMPERPNGKHP